MSELFTRFDSVFFEKTRLSALMYLLRQGTASFNQLKTLLKAPDGSLYTHMEKLVSSGYVEKRKELAGMAVQTVYCLSPKGRSVLLEYLDFMESMVKDRMEGKS